MVRRLLALVFALAFANLAARADTFTTFNVTGDYGITGTLMLDTTTNSFSAINFYGFTSIDGQALEGAGTSAVVYEIYALHNYFNVFGQPISSELDLKLDTPTLVGYNGSPLCSVADPCRGGLSTYRYAVSPAVFFSGSITPQSTAVTPEPSTLALLGTSALCALGAVRRRFYQRWAPQAIAN